VEKVTAKKIDFYAYQPASNSQGKQEWNEFYRIRVFKSGQLAPLLPEVSDRCLREE
jgi:hypothetical protein